MMYILGLITGILIMGLLVVVALMLEVPINRSIKQIKSNINRKGIVIEPESSEVEAWVKSLENEPYE